MSSPARLPKGLSDASQTPAVGPSSPAGHAGHAAPLNHHGGHGHSSSVAHSTASPAVTPATATATATATASRQPVGLSVFSSLWGDSTTAAPKAQPIVSDNTISTVPAIFTHAPLADAQEGPSDLAASTGSVPSTTTTLRDTLPPTQSAALRALNAPAFHSSPAKSKAAKSTSSRTTVTSQPVVVRTYSGSRHTSRPGSGFNTPRSFAMNGHSSISALTAGLASKSDQLPSADDFSFSAILRAVDPEIREAIDAIAEICAKSRMSLADEYDAHLPPQGEITGGGPSWAASTGALAGRGRLQRVTQGWTAAENTLMAVPEASSSSERLAQEGRIASRKRRSQSAYGSLKSVISGGSGKRKALDSDTFRDQAGGSSSHNATAEAQQQGPAWAVHASSSSQSQPAITLVTTPTASKQLSLDTSTTLSNLPEANVDEEPQPQTSLPRRSISHQRGGGGVSLFGLSSVSSSSQPQSQPHTRSSPLRSITSWLPWPRLSDFGTRSDQDSTTLAESRLREMLLSSQGIGKGKAAVAAL